MYQIQIRIRLHKANWFCFQHQLTCIKGYLFFVFVFNYLGILLGAAFNVLLGDSTLGQINIALVLVHSKIKSTVSIKK